MGAEIVGYIELTNDYQFEFFENKSLEELEKLADYIDSYSFVNNVSLNFYENLQSSATKTNDAIYNDNSTCYSKKVDTDNDGRLDTYYTHFNSFPDIWNEAIPSGDNWGLEVLQVLSAWDHKSDLHSVKVGIYDEGFAEHEDLFFDDIANNPIEAEKQEHGTHVAGTIAALHNNAIGISGIATDVKLYAYASGGNMYGSLMGNKIAYATLIGSHVKVINVSQQWADKTLQYAASQNNDIASRDKARNYIESCAEALAEFLNKLVVEGYDFVICVSAGNADDECFIADNNKTYGFRVATDAEKNNSAITKVGGGVLAKYGYDLTAIDDVDLAKRIIVVGAMKNNGGGIYSKATFSNYGDRIDFMAPGVDILSTFPTAIDPSGYRLNSGTSMASPHVAGVVAMMFQVNPSMRGSEVKEYIKNSATIVFSYEGINYLLPNASNCYNIAKTAKEYAENDINYPAGIACGYVKNMYNNAVKGVKITAIRNNVGENNLEKQIFYFESDADGYFVQALPQGNYSFVICEDDYLPYSVQNIMIEPDETLYLETLVLNRWISVVYLNTAVQGTIKDAINGEPISGAVVKLRKGWNNFSGSYCKDIWGCERSSKTGNDGTFFVDIAVGAYTAEIVKDGYIIGFYNVISGDTEYFDYMSYNTMVLTPVLDEDEYRIVLTWGETPNDLDSHLTYYVDEKQKFHLYYGNKNAQYNNNVVATLDLDDVTAYGPETITITLDTSLLIENAVFRYSVFDASNKNSVDSNVLSFSNAVVKVYTGNKLIRTYYIPKMKKGTVWHVFDIDLSGIKSINDFYNASGSGGVI